MLGSVTETDVWTVGGSVDTEVNGRPDEDSGKAVLVSVVKVFKVGYK